MTVTRQEKDTFGLIDVPANKLWGAQTQRSLQNFDISGEQQPREIIAALGGNGELNDRQKAAAELSLALIEEVKTADYVAIAVPMYNFGIPVQLKTWIDLICRAGITFSYTETGPQGLLTGKKVLIVTTTGGAHRNTATDLALAHAQTVLSFVGLKDITVAYAEALAMGPEAQERGLADATNAIQAFIAAH